MSHGQIGPMWWAATDPASMVAMVENWAMSELWPTAQIIFQDPALPTTPLEANMMRRNNVLSKAFLGFCSRKHRKAMSRLAVVPHVAPDTMPAPFVVEIAYDAVKHDRTNFFTGVGVFVSDRHVLTDAHILSAAIDKETVPLGDIPTEDKDFFIRYGSEKLGQGTIRHIKRIILHPDFKPPVRGERRPKGVCDLAILVVDDPVDVECVPIAEDHPLKIDSPVSALGWPLGGEGTGNLHQLNTAILPYSCGMSGGLTPREMVLANFAGRGAFDKGFSGGPVLFTPYPGKKSVLVGLMSRGAGGMSTEAQYGMPGIATDVTWHRDWIRSTCATTTPADEFPLPGNGSALK